MDITAKVLRQRAKLVTEGDIRRRVRGREITLEQGISQARAAGFVGLVRDLERDLATVKDGIKARLKTLVRDGAYTVAEALRNAQASGIDELEGFRAELAVARHPSSLSDAEIARRAAVLRQARTCDRIAA
ncbi:MAG: hypothetical protein WDN10_02925 [bacterium]